ncbi:unnamed protein product, partial [Prunus brigantina]
SGGNDTTYGSLPWTHNSVREVSLCNDSHSGLQFLIPQILSDVRRLSALGNNWALNDNDVKDSQSDISKCSREIGEEEEDEELSSSFSTNDFNLLHRYISILLRFGGIWYFAKYSNESQP